MANLQNLQGQFLGFQPLILLANFSMCPEFLPSGGIMLQILGLKYLKFFRPLLIVFIGPVIKSVCDRRL